MRDVLRALLAAILAAMTAEAAAQPFQTDTDEPQITFIESTRDASVVSAIDKNTRTVTLHYPDGNSITIEAGPEVRNFEQIRVGDTVLTEHHQMTKIVARAPQFGETASERNLITRSSPGEKPHGTAILTTESAAVVESVDVGTRTIVLRGADGRRREIDVPQSTQGLEKFSAGNTVTVQQTEAIAIAVTE